MSRRAETIGAAGSRINARRYGFSLGGRITASAARGASVAIWCRDKSLLDCAAVAAFAGVQQFANVRGFLNARNRQRMYETTAKPVHQGRSLTSQQSRRLLRFPRGS